MVTRTIDSRGFAEKVRQIRARVPTVLAQWGLCSKFARWRLTQDPITGLVVLFGVLNNTLMTTHRSPPFNDYFDPRLLLDLGIALKMPVVSSDREGFCYAFILDRGQLGALPDRVDLPEVERSRLLVGSTYTIVPTTEAWDEATAVVDPTELDQPDFDRQENYQALADFQWAVIDAQATASPRFKKPPALVTPNRGLSNVVARLTVLAQVEAEIERRRALYQPWPGNPKSLNGPTADNWVISRSELVHLLRLMLDKYDDLARLQGESRQGA
jgi:hypothetical protein